jgi:casein kinase II subunit beta
LVPEKTEERFVQKCFGFKVHSSAALSRWQEERKEEMLARLRGELGQQEGGGEAVKKEGEFKFGKGKVMAVSSRSGRK